MDARVALLDWPHRSPDSNPIENLWGILVQSVYENGRRFDYEDDLRDAIEMAWDRWFFVPYTIRFQDILLHRCCHPSRFYHSLLVGIFGNIWVLAFGFKMLHA